MAGEMGLHLLGVQLCGMVVGVGGVVSVLLFLFLPPPPFFGVGG